VPSSQKPKTRKYQRHVYICAPTQRFINTSRNQNIRARTRPFFQAEQIFSIVFRFYVCATRSHLAGASVCPYSSRAQKLVEPRRRSLYQTQRSRLWIVIILCGSITRLVQGHCGGLTQCRRFKVAKDRNSGRAFIAATPSSMCFWQRDAQTERGAAAPGPRSTSHIP
jgi:hypothetical protein